MDEVEASDPHEEIANDGVDAAEGEKVCISVFDSCECR
jgi:hypothetical protein